MYAFDMSAFGVPLGPHDATSLNLYLWLLALSVGFFCESYPFLSNKINAVTLLLQIKVNQCQSHST